MPCGRKPFGKETRKTMKKSLTLIEPKLLRDTPTPTETELLKEDLTLKEANLLKHNETNPLNICSSTEIELLKQSL